MFELTIDTPGILIVIDNRYVRTPLKIRISEKELKSIINTLKINGIDKFSYTEIEQSESPTFVQLSRENQVENSFKLARKISHSDEACDAIIDTCDEIYNQYEEQYLTSKDINIIELKKLSTEAINNISKNIF